ncbi:hypothetical protein N9Q58_04495, partial [Polaribacter sp.]|nr:hypothetical protein [Polaribacter sp.]
PWLINRAHSGERLLYNFEKIKFYVENNPQIELILLGYWYNTLLYDKDWVLNGKDVQYRYESYLPLQLLNGTEVDYLNVPENKKLFWENYLGYKIGYPSPAVKLAVKNYFTFNNALEMKGGFGFRKERMVYTKKESVYEKDTSSIRVDSLALKNLKDIVSYLKEKKVKLVLLNTPLLKEFFAPLKTSNVDLMDSIAMSYVDQKNVWYLNFSSYKLANKYFGNIDHLNLDGANFLTPILIDTIKSVTTNKKHYSYDEIQK